MIDGWGNSCECLIWMSLDFIDDQSSLVQVMAWCRQATSHNLSQCWPRSLPPYVVTMPEWVNWCYCISLTRYPHNIIAFCMLNNAALLELKSNKASQIYIYNKMELGCNMSYRKISASHPVAFLCVHINLSLCSLIDRSCWQCLSIEQYLNLIWWHWGLAIYCGKTFYNLLNKDPSLKKIAWGEMHHVINLIGIYHSIGISNVSCKDGPKYWKCFWVPYIFPL